MIIPMKVSAGAREAMLAASAAGKAAASVAQAKPLTLAHTKRYLIEWSGLSAVKPQTALHTEKHYVLTAKDRMGERLEVRVDRVGYSVNGTEYHDVWTRPAVDWSEAEAGWEQVDSIGLDA